MLLWKEVCSNKLLAKVDLVLFLNKCDILASKLKSGVRLAKYVRSFADRPNEPEVVEKCEYMLGSIPQNDDVDVQSRLQEQVQCHPSGALSHTPQILRLLHICNSKSPVRHVVTVFDLRRKQDTTTTGGIIASGIWTISALTEDCR